jgi:hypothetical protein
VGVKWPASGCGGRHRCRRTAGSSGALEASPCRTRAQIPPCASTA